MVVLIAVLQLLLSSASHRESNSGFRNSGSPIHVPVHVIHSAGTCHGPTSYRDNCMWATERVRVLPGSRLMPGPHETNSRVSSRLCLPITINGH